MTAVVKSAVYQVHLDHLDLAADEEIQENLVPQEYQEFLESHQLNRVNN